MGELIGIALGSLLWVAAFSLAARKAFGASLMPSLWIGYAGSVAIAAASFLWQPPRAATTWLVGYAAVGPLSVLLHRLRLRKRVVP